MSALDPSGPSQPSQNTAYTTEGNPASKNPSEQQASAHHRKSEAVETRVPTTQGSYEDAKPSALGQGIHGAGPGEEARGKTEEDVGRHQELDAQQIAAPGEGRVWEAVEGKGGKSGASGSQPDLASDLDRKKAEQAPLRDRIEGQREKDVDVAGALGQRGGPANPVGKNNYPNTGD